MTDLAVVTADQLAPLPSGQRELAVTQYLTDARDRLTLAMSITGPEAVAAIKAEIATAAEATKQLGLSKEIQTDAQEMVRRAEFALGKAVRAAQERGEVRIKGESGGPRTDYVRAGELVHVHADQGDEGPKMSPTSMFSTTKERRAAYEMADNASPAEFNAALADARQEDDLSRANVIRKIHGVKNDGMTPVERLVRIRELAPTGATSGQIAAEIGVGEEHVRRIAKANGITITADEVLRGTRRLKVDSNRIVNEAVSTLDGLVSGIALINYDDLDADQMQNWAASLTESIRVLNRFAKQIKEKAQ